MNDYEVLESKQAAKVLTMLVLGKADRVFPRCRRTMEDRYGFTILSRHERKTPDIAKTNSRPCCRKHNG